jgi:hypothetical protein
MPPRLLIAAGLQLWRPPTCGRSPNTRPASQERGAFSCAPMRAGLAGQPRKPTRPWPRLKGSHRPRLTGSLARAPGGRLDALDFGRSGLNRPVRPALYAPAPAREGESCSATHGLRAVEATTNLRRLAFLNRSAPPSLAFHLARKHFSAHIALERLKFWQAAQFRNTSGKLHAGSANGAVGRFVVPAANVNFVRGH